MVSMTNVQQNNEHFFTVVHPLDDVMEQKCDATNLGPMNMTPSVKFSLMALRGYLVVMGVLVLFHVLDVAGVFKHLH